MFVGMRSCSVCVCARDNIHMHVIGVCVCWLKSRLCSVITGESFDEKPLARSGDQTAGPSLPFPGGP